MAFRTPNFNLAVSIWRFTSLPTTNPPDVVTTGNLTPGRRVQEGAVNGGLQGHSYVLLPALTDVRGVIDGAVPSGDIMEVPTGSGRFYFVQWVEDVAKGFANEYRMAAAIHTVGLIGVPTWPFPTP